MAEKSLWSYLRKGMKPYWSHARRHEDLIGLGVPDVSYYHYGNSWIELKEIKELPKRQSTGINLGQWHKNGGAQRHFLIKRKAWLLIRVNNPSRIYLLFNYHILPPSDRPYWNWLDMRNNAVYIWRTRIDFQTLSSILKDPE